MLPPIAAEPIFYIKNFVITNAILNSWIAVLFFLALSLTIRLRISFRPGKLQNMIEAAVEFSLSFFDQVTGDRKKSEKFFPFVASLFVFILFSNWIGLVPGTGSIGIWEFLHGKLELVPIFRPANSDLNLTLAMAVSAVVFSHIFGVFSIGFFKHIGKYIQFGALIKGFKKGPIGIFSGVVEFAIGFIELIGEAAKMASLSLRLFGNIFAGEILITVIGGLIAFLIPLPFMALELLVGLIQAAVFALLTLVYFTVATESPHHSE